MRPSTAVAIYALALLGSATAVGATESLVRPARSIGRRDLVRATRVDFAALDDISVRFEAGKSLPADPESQLRIGSHLLMLRREAALRDEETACVLLAAAASLVFLVVAAPRAIRLRRFRAPRGIVEIIADEFVSIVPEALPTEMSKLVSSRHGAIEALLASPRLVCAYCGKPSSWEVLGQVGRRVLRKRASGGAKDLGIELGRGWWHRLAVPVPCRKCGSTETVGA